MAVGVNVREGPAFVFFMCRDGPITQKLDLTCIKLALIYQ